LVLEESLVPRKDNKTKSRSDSAGIQQIGAASAGSGRERWDTDNVRLAERREESNGGNSDDDAYGKNREFGMDRPRSRENSERSTDLSRSGWRGVFVDTEKGVGRDTSDDIKKRDG
jgi:hypothetical protein